MVHAEFEWRGFEDTLSIIDSADDGLRPATVYGEIHDWVQAWADQLFTWAVLRITPKNCST